MRSKLPEDAIRTRRASGMFQTETFRLNFEPPHLFLPSLLTTHTLCAASKGLIPVLLTSSRRLASISRTCEAWNYSRFQSLAFATRMWNLEDESPAQKAMVLYLVGLVGRAMTSRLFASPVRLGIVDSRPTEQRLRMGTAIPGTVLQRDKRSRRL